MMLPLPGFASAAVLTCRPVSWAGPNVQVPCAGCMPASAEGLGAAVESVPVEEMPHVIVDRANGVF
ncbi:MAG: hypothetical protein ACYCXZ_03125 [Coriobacteriia bacterium]